MSAPSTSSPQFVDIEDLVCPGCGDPVHGDPPTGWPADDSVVPRFSHTDGTALCSGGEPIEAVPSHRGPKNGG